MNKPTTIARGNRAASNRYNGEDAHSVNIRLTPKSVDLSVRSRDKGMIMTIVGILVFGFVGMVVSLTLILRLFS